VKKNFTYYIRTIQAQGIAFVLLLCMLFSPFISSAQLTIKENTIVSFHQDVTSKSSQNSIFSDVQGDNALILSSKAEFLYVGDNVSLYDLIIENSSSFKILSPVQLRGDLEVQSGALALHHPILVAGQVILGAEAVLLNPEYITKQQLELFAANSIAPNANNFTTTVVSVTSSAFLKSEMFSYKQANSSTRSLKIFFKQYDVTPSTPPPEHIS
jgi:hypothetical protein